jgi:hypothetical protein
LRDDDVERCSQRASDLVGDYHPASRQADHDGISGAVWREPRSQAAPGMATILEHVAAPLR